MASEIVRRVVVVCVFDFRKKKCSSAALMVLFQDRLVVGRFCEFISYSSPLW